MGTSGWLAGSITMRLQEPDQFAEVAKRLADVDSSGGVAIYDVGQGTCQAALDGELKIPTLYVDFGGGILFNRKTFPEPFAGFCFSKGPMIVLSHWDWDHWSSAYRNEEAMTVPWIAPPVPLKPIQQAFAADLYTRGLLNIWDDTWPADIRAGGVRIERCTGRTSNDSGLAITLYASGKSSRNCLLPGDAAYRYIPSVLNGTSFNALSMTHHGGKLHSLHYPKPKKNAASAISVGARNSYQHPLFETIASHIGQGWKYPVGTGFSGQRPCHVMLPWGGSPHVFQGGCFGGSCAVAIASIVPAYKMVHVAKLAAPLHKSKEAQLG